MHWVWGALIVALIVAAALVVGTWLVGRDIKKDTKDNKFFASDWDDK